MRKNSIKITIISLTTLFFFAFFFITEGAAKRLANDRSEFQSSKSPKNLKQVQSKKPPKRANLRNTKERKIPVNRQRHIKNGKLNYPIGVGANDFVGRTTTASTGTSGGASLGATANVPDNTIATTPVTVTTNPSINGVFLPAAYTFFQFQGNIQKITRDAVVFTKEDGSTIRVMSNFIPYAMIPIGQRNRLQHISGGIKLLPRQLVNYGFFPFPTGTSLSTFMTLVLNKTSKDNYFVGYLSRHR